MSQTLSSLTSFFKTITNKLIGSKDSYVTGEGSLILDVEMDQWKRELKNISNNCQQLETLMKQ
jgi:hypothetical protein